MIWWLIVGIIGGVIGVANAILNRLRNTAAKQRQRWANEYQAVERQIQQYDRQIQYKLQEAQYTVDFHVLTNLHFESMKIADHAYELLKDSRVALDAIGNAIVEAAKEKNRLIAEKRSLPSYSSRKPQLEQEIGALVELGNQLYPDKDQLKTQRDHFHNQVAQFNARTHTLKLAIRDRCGERGQDWFRRLEARTSIREENRRRQLAGLPLLSMPESIKSPPKLNQRPRLVQKTRGTVKWFDAQKGFGFITPDDGQPDIHVNRNNLVNAKELAKNDRVEFERMQGDKGPWARNVQKV